MEMIDDWMQEGYRLSQLNDEIGAVKIWSRTWQALRPHLPDRVDDIWNDFEVFDGTQSVGNWIYDFETSIENAVRRDSECAEGGFEFCADVIGMLGDDGRSVVNFRLAIALCLFAQQKDAEALSTMEENIRVNPQDVWAYIYLADMYGHLFGDDFLPLDLERAESLLNQASEYAVKEEKSLIEERRVAYREAAAQQSPV